MFLIAVAAAHSRGSTAKSSPGSKYCTLVPLMVMPKFRLATIMRAQINWRAAGVHSQVHKRKRGEPRAEVGASEPGGGGCADRSRWQGR